MAANEFFMFMRMLVAMMNKCMSLFCILVVVMVDVRFSCFFFQAEDGIRDLVRSRGLGDVYKRQEYR